jgi:hypothetical protein
MLRDALVRSEGYRQERDALLIRLQDMVGTAKDMEQVEKDFMMRSHRQERALHKVGLFFSPTSDPNLWYLSKIKSEVNSISSQIAERYEITDALRESCERLSYQLERVHTLEALRERRRVKGDVHRRRVHTEQVSACAEVGCSQLTCNVLRRAVENL